MLRTTLPSCFSSCFSPPDDQYQIEVERTGSPKPQMFRGEVLKLGDRHITKAVLNEWDIKVGRGVTGETVGKGAFGCVYDFYLNGVESRDDCHPARASLGVNWVFKPEESIDAADYQNKITIGSSYPLSESGWLHSTFRSVLSYNVAKIMGIDNFVESHIGIFNTSHGTLMRKVKGPTVHDWLISENYFERVASDQELNDGEIQELVSSQPKNEQFKTLMLMAFKTAVGENDLHVDWNAIQCVDYLTGQCDRFKLSNMMVAKNEKGLPKLIAIDNDLSFPVNNNYLPINCPHKSSEIEIKSYSKLLQPLVEEIQPSSLNAFLDRVKGAENRWFGDEIFHHMYSQQDHGSEGLFSSQKGWSGSGRSVRTVEFEKSSTTQYPKLYRQHGHYDVFP